jgi:hypothetical protein
MFHNTPPRQYLPGSAPDIVARLRHALEATQTARILMREGIGALELHLDHLDAHLRRLIADIEGRPH